MAERGKHVAYYPTDIPQLGGLEYVRHLGTPGYPPKHAAAQGKHAKPYSPEADIKQTFTPRISKRTKKPSGPYQAKHMVKPVTQASPVSAAVPAGQAPNPNYTAQVARKAATASPIAQKVYKRFAAYNMPAAPPGNAQKAVAAVKKYGAPSVAKSQQKKNLNKSQFKLKAFKSQHEGKNRLVLEGLAKNATR